MSSRNSTPIAEPRRPEFEVGQLVRTPSGALAEILAIYYTDDEALVQWTSGDRARFKLGLLRPGPKSEPAP